MAALFAMAGPGLGAPAAAAPAAPTLYSATPQCDGTTTGISLSWSSSSGATSYEIWRDGSYLATTQTAGTTFWNTTSSMNPGQSYSYQVKAKNSTGTSGLSNSQSAVAPNCAPAAAAPAAPTLYSATPQCDGTTTGISLSWSSSSGATSYEIWRDGSYLATTQTAGTTFWNTTSSMNPGQSYSYQVKAKNSTGTSGLSNSQSAVAPNCGSTAQTLVASLTANPASGFSPLVVQLSASVLSGTATGTVNYTFYCHRADTGTNITSPWSAKTDGSPYITAGATCTYQAAGTYTAKVIIERGSAPPAEARTTVTVSPPAGQTLSASLSARPTSGPAPLTVTLSASVSGSAIGTINYTFYCDRADSGTNITAGWVAKFDGTFANPQSASCSYASAGTYTAKVIVERGSAPPAEARITITVSGATASFGGRVYDAVSNQSISGATVSWGADTRLTDAVGSYQFSNVPCTGRTLTAWAQGYLASSPGTYTPFCNLSNSKDIALQPTAQSLTVQFSGSPATSGPAPLTVTLSASVSGSAIGTINYTFYCDRVDAGTNITPPWSAKFDGSPYIAAGATCNYSSAGTYTAKVIVERGSAPPAQAQVVITVGGATLTASLSASATIGTAPLTVTLSASVSGSAIGTINYTFYCDRADSGTNITAGWVAKFDGTFANPQSASCSYASAGTYTAKVIVERGSAPPAEARVTVRVTNQVAVRPASLVIRTASISVLTSAPGRTAIRVRVSVLNEGGVAARTSGPEPGTSFPEDYSAPSAEPGTWRVGVEFDNDLEVEAGRRLDHRWRWGFGGEVLPGAEGIAYGDITLTTPGTRTFYVGLVHEGVAWTPWRHGPSATSVTVAPPASVRPASLVIRSASIETISSAPGRTTIRVRVSVLNEGDEPAKTSGPTPGTSFPEDYAAPAAARGTWRVGVEFDDDLEVEAGRRLDHRWRWGFGGEVLPGAEGIAYGDITLTTPGTRTFYVGLVHEGVAWTPWRHGPSATSVTVAPPASVRPASLVLRNASINEVDRRPGSTTIRIQAVVFNEGDETARTGPNTGTAYREDGPTFQDAARGTWRVALHIDGRRDYPWRWGFGGDILGQSQGTASGEVTLTTIGSRTVYLGLVHEYVGWITERYSPSVRSVTVDSAPVVRFYWPTTGNRNYSEFDEPDGSRHNGIDIQDFARPEATVESCPAEPGSKGVDGIDRRVSDWRERGTCSDWRGAPVNAAAGGMVIEVGETAENGHFIRILHGRLSDGRFVQSVYLHMGSKVRVGADAGGAARQSFIAPSVRENTCVGAGSLLGNQGYSGTTQATHLHFSIIEGGTYVITAGGKYVTTERGRYVNPRNYLPKSAAYRDSEVLPLQECAHVFP